jgi:hypothetical protein
MAGSGFSASPNQGEFRNIGSPGVRSTGAYLIGSRPFILKVLLAADTKYKVNFPYITRAVTVINQDPTTADTVDVAFNSADDAFDDHSISLDNNRDSITMNIRTNAIYLQTQPGAATGSGTNVEIFAELTDIPSARFGAGWEGAGIVTAISVDGSGNPNSPAGSGTDIELV